VTASPGALPYLSPHLKPAGEYEMTTSNVRRWVE
jgi:hypothetical protein